MKFLWNQPKINQLKSLWQTGLTAAQIGQLLGTTKCSVIGKANRLMLPSRRERIKDNRPPPRSVEANMRPVKPRNPKAWVNKAKRKKTLAELNPDECRWPIGDNAPYMFCGGKRENEHKPYCCKHNAVAYRMRMGYIHVGELNGKIKSS